MTQVTNNAHHSSVTHFHLPRARHLGVAPAIVAIALLASCEPMVIIERNEIVTIPAGARWAWTAPDGDGLSPDQGSVLATEAVDRELHRAIGAELEARGYRRTSGDSADFFVHFHVGHREVVDTLPPIPSRTSAQPVRDDSNWGVYGSPEQMNARTATWQEGMLIVDALTADNGTLAWRGIIVGEIRPATAEAPAAAIRAAVGRLIARFP